MAPRPRALLLLAAALLAAAAPAAADNFDVSRLDKSGGEWGLVRGDPRCPAVFRFDDDDVTIAAKDISVDKAACAGGALVLAKNPGSGGSLLTDALRGMRDRGSSFEGALLAPLTCGAVKLVQGTYFQFFSPKKGLDVNLTATLGGNAPLAANATGDFTFGADRDYLIVGAECIYSRRSLFHGSACFPATATVTLASGAAVPVSSLSTGDSVHVGRGEYSPVFLWTHRDAAAAPARAYVQLVTARGALTLTAGHYVYVNGDLSAPVAASAVRVGDALVAGDGGRAAVVAVRAAAGAGLYNPQTLHGDIVVDGVVTTTYTSAVPPAAAHALLAPLRWAHRAASAAAAGGGLWRPHTAA